jgi:ribosome biogenesis GTPase
MHLSKLGWDSFFEAHFKEVAGHGSVPARVACEQRQFYTVYTEFGEMGARVAGRIMHKASSRADFPAVGDWVAVRPRLEERQATIHAVLPRKSMFSRKVATAKTEEQVVAANVDTVFLVSALGFDFNLRRIERYLTLAWESGAKPVIVLNKADLCPDVDARLAEVEGVAMGVPVHAVSALEGSGLDGISAYLPEGKSGAALGSSGVGKSTIINGLLGRELLETGDVRQADGKGRHVTSTRQLVPLPSGGFMIDTPGMRELQLWADEESLQESFDDVDELARSCRFRDCGHDSEPGCAVREALEGGRLDESRFKSYLKLQKELTILSMRKDQRARIKEARFKEISKWSKQLKKHDPKRRA